MRKILIATHGHFAEGIKSSLTILLGERNEVTTVSAYVDETDVTKEYEAFFTSVMPEDEAIVFTDLYGGSVNQQLFTLSEQYNAIQITGFNLPILLEIILSPDKVTKDKAKDLIEACREELKVVEPEHQEEDFF
ncbi:PTS sugar transporter subunit IIA [Enterococcus olivae]